MSGGLWISDFLVDVLNVSEDLVAACLLLAAGHEMRWKLLPGLTQGCHVVSDILIDFLVGQLVCLGEDDGEGDAACPEPVDEFEVDGLWGMADVPQEGGHPRASAARQDARSGDLRRRPRPAAGRQEPDSHRGEREARPLAFLLFRLRTACDFSVGNN